jgi:hypothetical protein
MAHSRCSRASVGSAVRAAAGNLDGHVPVRRLDGEIARDNLLALGEGPVEDALLAVAGADPPRLRNRVQGRATLERSVPEQAHRVFTYPLDSQPALLFGSNEVGVFIQDSMNSIASILRRLLGISH